MMGPLPLELAVATKAIAHWLTTGLPLVVIAPLLGLMLNVELKAMGWLALTLFAGTPALTFIGLIGAALSVALRRGGLVARGVGAATHRARADLRRRRSQCRDRRAHAVRPTFHHSLCAKLGELGARPDRRGGGSSPWIGMSHG